MLALISKLQRKPERVRKKIAFAAALSITGVIVFIWLTSFSASVGEPPVAAAKNEDESGPLQTFAGNVSTFFSDALEIMQAALSAFSNSPQDAVNGTKEPQADSAWGDRKSVV